MSNYLTLFKANIYFTNPQDIYALIGMVVFLCLLLYFLRKNWELISISFQKDWIVFAILSALTPLVVLIGGFRIHSNALPLPNLPGELQEELLMIFFAVPWQMAAGFLGIVPAFILGVISGISLGAFETHNFFTVLETASMALLFAYFVRQNYRSRIFAFLRVPIVASLATAVIMLPIMIIVQFLNVGGSAAVRIDYGLTQTIQIALIRCAEIILGGLLVSFFYFLHNKFWKFPKTLIPSPIEQRIENRFLLSVFPFIIIIILVLIFSDWKLAGGAAKTMIEDRLKNSAEITAQSVPYFMEAGQNLTMSLAKTDLLNPGESIEQLLAERLRSTPFFKQLFVFDENGTPLTGYPSQDVDQLLLTSEELAGIELSRQGVSIQTYTNLESNEQNSALITFIAAIKDENGNNKGVLLTRSDFASNPFTQPSLNALQKLMHEGGEGMILDDKNRILYQASASVINPLNVYQGDLPDNQGIFESYSPQSVRQIDYFQPIVGSNWRVVVSIPAQQSQELALSIAGPLLIILLVILVLVFVLLRLSLRPISNTLTTMKTQASLIAQGNLENPMRLISEDEFGQLANSFEQMRMRLKNRLDELNQLLISSQAIGQHLDIFESYVVLLEAALSTGASYARIILTSDVLTERTESQFIAIGADGSKELITPLDQQLFENLKTHDKLVIQNMSRARRMLSPDSQINPRAILAVPLHNENQYYGVLWVGFLDQRVISEEEIRFISTLASQAAVAAANAKLYSTAEIGRQRLEAVLNSAPEPVMVFDEDDRLLLMNPAACQLRGLVNATTAGNLLADVITNKELYDLLVNFNSNRDSSIELQVSNDRTYFVSVSAVNNNQHMVGKVCLLRDITHFRQLDNMKSDVVDSVSHDLRSPLTFMRGYATMMQMVGELNEQQREYVGKIVGGIDFMTKLVNNLLDISRMNSGIAIKTENVIPDLIVQQVVSQLQPAALQKSIEVFIDSQLANDLTIQADVEMLHQAIFNLVDNAIKFTGMSGKVGIFISKEKENVLFEVRDTGIGIAPLDRPHLFDKFYRSNRRESYKQKGTGLGLAIVKAVSERHNGRAWVESKLGRGSSFYLEIPIIHINAPGEEVDRKETQKGILN